MTPKTTVKVPDAEFKKRFEIISAMAPKDVKNVGGYASGDRTTLYLTGTLDKGRNYGTVDMVKKAVLWTIRRGKLYEYSSQRVKVSQTCLFVSAMK
jgi:hypothetical protein